MGLMSHVGRNLLKAYQDGLVMQCQYYPGQYYPGEHYQAAIAALSPTVPAPSVPCQIDRLQHDIVPLQPDSGSGPSTHH